MKKTKEEAEVTRRTLLLAALKIFSDKGYASSTLADIATEADVTRGAIYHHFGSKAELYKELLAEYSARGGRIIAEAIEEGGTIAEILHRVLRRQMEYLEEDPEFRAVMELTTFKIAYDPELETVVQERQQETVALVESLSGAMRQGIQSGSLRADLDPVQAARAFVAFQHGILMLWMSNQEAFSIRKNAAELADTFLNGLI